MKAINYPFRLDGFGRIETTTDQRKIYLDRLITLLSTVVTQRIMRPTYGTDLSTALYQNAGDETAGLIQSINDAVSAWIPTVTVKGIQVGAAGEDGVSRVNVQVTLPDFSDASVSVNTSYLAQNGSIYQ